MIQAAEEDTEIFPHLNNYNSNTQSWDADVGECSKDAGKPGALREQILRFFDGVSGLSRPLAGF